MSGGITKAGKPAIVAEAFAAQVEQTKTHAPDAEKAVLDAHLAAVKGFCDVAGDVTVVAESSGSVSIASGNGQPSTLVWGNQNLVVRVIG